MSCEIIFCFKLFCFLYRSKDASHAFSQELIEKSQPDHMRYIWNTLLSKRIKGAIDLVISGLDCKHLEARLDALDFCVENGNSLIYNIWNLM